MRVRNIDICDIENIVLSVWITRAFQENHSVKHCPQSLHHLFLSPILAFFHATPLCFRISLRSYVQRWGEEVEGGDVARVEKGTRLKVEESTSPRGSDKGNANLAW